jgi:integrase
MSKPYRLQPHFDKKRNRWHLNLPAKISPSGRRERHYFEKHSDALAEANKIRQVFHDYGRSIKMLPANRLLESIEVWDLLDEAAGVSVSSGTLRRIVIAEVNKRKAREKSITLNALFDDYLAKLKKINRSEGYMKQFRWLRGFMDFWLETKVSDLTPGNIKFSLQKLPSGNFNSHLRLLRAVLNHGIKNGWLKTNPALSLDFAHREKQEVTCLHPSVVERMFRHAQQNDIELIPSFAIGFFCGLREAELWRMSWKSVNLDDPHPHVMVPAAITKTKEPRTVPLSDNAIAWLEWFFTNVRRPDPDQRLMQGWTPTRLRNARTRAVGSEAKWTQNCKRHCFASYWLALHRNLQELVLLLGHTTSAMARRHYLGQASYTDAQAYFEIRP